MGQRTPSFHRAAKWSRRTRNAAPLVSVSMLSCTAILAATPDDQLPSPAIVIIVAFALATIAPLMIAVFAAVREGGAQKFIHDHISGWNALGLIAGIVAVSALGSWATSRPDTHQSIDPQLGLGVLVLLSVIFIVGAILSQLPTDLPRIDIPGVRSLGRVLSTLDAFAVSILAIIGGSGIRHSALRYAVTIATMLSCAILAVRLASPWGLMPLSWAFLLALSIGRRWAWVEWDREAFVRYRAPILRVGFEQDLRDETMLVTVAAFLLIPIAYSELQSIAIASNIELFYAETPVRLMDWYQFFGSELAKALPLLDWAEVYDVHGSTPIVAKSSTARHIIFATRILFDLVLIGVLLQAIAVSNRNAERKALFFDGLVGRVDPFIERRLLCALVQPENDTWIPIPAALEAFPKYDEDRLTELAIGADPQLSVAARSLLDRDGIPWEES